MIWEFHPKASPPLCCPRQGTQWERQGGPGVGGWLTKAQGCFLLCYPLRCWNETLDMQRDLHRYLVTCDSCPGSPGEASASLSPSPGGTADHQLGRSGFVGRAHQRLTRGSAHQTSETRCQAMTLCAKQPSPTLARWPQRDGRRTASSHCWVPRRDPEGALLLHTPQFHVYSAQGLCCIKTL